MGTRHPTKQQAAGPSERARQEIARDTPRDPEDGDEQRHDRAARSERSDAGEPADPIEPGGVISTMRTLGPSRNRDDNSSGETASRVCKERARRTILTAAEKNGIEIDDGAAPAGEAPLSEGPV